MITRRAIIGTAAALIASSARVRASRADKIRIGLVPVTDIAPLYVGLKKGFFADEGIELEITPMTSGAVGIPALIGGAFDITYGNTVSSILAAAHGLDVKIIAVALKGADATVLARKDSNITSGKDLVGKTLGVNARNNIIWLVGRDWVDLTGGDPTKVNFREIGFSQMPDALAQKQIDAVVQIEPFRTRMLSNPDIVQVAKPYDLVQPGVQVGNYVTTSAFTKDKKDTVARFVSAMDKSAAWFNQNLSDGFITSTIADFTKSSEETVKLTVLRPASPGIDLDEMTKTMKLMRKHGLLQKDINIDQIVYKR